ncbi:MAG TPA: glycosyltransferase [Usitatibacter sp.]|nr:glycosyltransferase [Usitatibacter sp.]
MAAQAPPLTRAPAAADSATAVRFVATSESRDFAAELRRVAAAHVGRDVIVLAQGAVLPFLFDERLRKAACAGPGIAAAVPMCDVSPLYELVGEERRPLGPEDAILVDRSAYSMGLRRYYEVPRIHPVCAYIRRDALDAVLPAAGHGTAQEILDGFVRAWASRGLSCVLTDYLYVGLEGEAPRGAQSLERIEEQAFARHHPLGGLRRAMNEALANGLPAVSTPGLDTKPVQLHIMHYWGGGLDRWVRDFARADASRVNLILATYRIGENGGQRVVLYSDPSAAVPVRTWDIARAIRSTAAGSLEYRAILEQVIAEFDVEAIVVSSLIGHALDALAMPVKTIVVCHDFYPVCQAINPQFHGTCVRCTAGDLAECARANPLNRIFVDQTSAEWNEMRSRYVELLLERRIEMVVPSRSVEETMKRIEPRLAAAPMHLIPHGVDADVPKLAFPPHGEGERLRLVVLGRLSLHKGMELLRAAKEGLAPLADVVIVGGGGNGARLAEACGWKCIEKYDLDDLPGILADIAPHAAILASIVPETFSYTLSELWALGVPPLATALGSFQERIADGETGFLFKPDAASLVKLVARLQREPGRLASVAERLVAHPHGRTTAEMVAAYHALVPLSPRPAARFTVGIGRENALTEPYRHLNEAYVHLSEAYDQVRGAYEQVQEAQRQATADHERARAEIAGHLEADAKRLQRLEALELRTHWWRAGIAQAMLDDWHEKIRSEAKKEKQK